MIEQSDQPEHAVSVAVVIPCYRVTRHIQGVIASLGDDVHAVYCVDDACPDGSGDFIEANVHDARVRVVRHAQNRGVGGAVMTGYKAAIADGHTILVKVDGDGQMEGRLVSNFVAPIARGEADYTKGNRFWDLSRIGDMPLLRRVGNLGLSFMAKASSGYWDVFDPTNGFTAIHADVAAALPFEAISERYFFETDILFRLNTMRAVVVDVPMDARYADEVSGLKVSKILFEFSAKHLRNTVKRILYRYFLRDLSIASFEFVVGGALLLFSLVYGLWNWIFYAQSQSAAPVGTIMVAVVTFVSGLQFLLAFANFDIASVPRQSLHQRLKGFVRAG
ncbi:glycosyltransferase family 2 protein [Stenotrophomonas maltophilia]|uniref:glycosyltransferase family 2 protein n=1 Tax=Stenotrophomonas pavanii TaxID=487698 RepID=UPI00231921C4|nr:glycosyltransferase family 2 protein [Stenotrophomonas maltophilia]